VYLTAFCIFFNDILLIKKKKGIHFLFYFCFTFVVAFLFGILILILRIEGLALVLANFGSHNCFILALAI
jgi:hypothetical protein